MTACNDCWDEAFRRSQIGGGHQAEHYEALLLLSPTERPWCASGKCDEPLGYYGARCGRPPGHEGGHVGPFAIERGADA